MAPSKLQVFQFPCREDNYGVIIADRDAGFVASIDAPEEEPILEVLEDKRLALTHILTTHHHGDHVAGNAALKARFGCHIIGPEAEAAKIPAIDQTVKHGDRLDLMGHAVDVIATPGHTAGEVSYYLSDQSLLFAGDTLFAMGCGRLFEGDAATMHTSLQRLAALPDETRVYAGHEYTLSNAKFALSVDAGNAALVARAREVELLRDDGKPTLPTTIGLEKQTNPFLRTANPAIRSHLGLESASDEEVFAALRAGKDRF